MYIHVFVCRCLCVWDYGIGGSRSPDLFTSYLKWSSMDKEIRWFRGWCARILLLRNGQKQFEETKDWTHTSPFGKQTWQWTSLIYLIFSCPSQFLGDFRVPYSWLPAKKLGAAHGSHIPYSMASQEVAKSSPTTWFLKPYQILMILCSRIFDGNYFDS